jgi:hypothetical protein
MSAVEPGYLKKILPSGPPEEGEAWSDIQRDIDTKILPGLTHWCVTPPRLGHVGANKPFQAISQFHGLLPLELVVSGHAW